MSIPDKLRDEVLQRIGVTDMPSLDERGLTAVYEAWCRHVPFDNIRKWIHVASGDDGPLPGSTAEDFFQAFITHGTGGTCWAGNGALHSLLESIGFDTVRGVATMLVAPTLPPNHGTVIVRIKEQDWLVDASMLHVVPLRLFKDASRGALAAPFGFRLSRADDHWFVRWLPANYPDGLVCRIDYFPADEADFAMRHESTRAWSPFNYSLVARTVRGKCTVGTMNLEWYQLGQGGEFSLREVTRNERAEMLIQLGYSEEIVSQLPHDQPTPPPPGSATAARAMNEVRHPDSLAD